MRSYVRNILRTILPYFTNKLFSLAFPPLMFYKFGTKYKFFVAIATLRSLLTSKDGYVEDLALEPLATSQDEILTKMSNELHDNYKTRMKDALKQNEIQFSLCPYTEDIYVNKCSWNTLAKISKFVEDVKCDVIVSGGGVGKFRHHMHNIRGIKDLTSSLQKDIASCCARYSGRKVRSITVGVIDSGSVPFPNSRVRMNKKMFDATKDPACYTDYYDSFRGGLHGTGVVEILMKSLLPETKVYVANVGGARPISGKAVALAMWEFKDKGVDVINCSFDGYFNNR